MKDLKLPKLRGPANFEPTSANAQARTVDLVWYTGTPVLRYNFWSDETFELAFSMEKSAVRMGRLQSGAPLLNAHANYRVSDSIGVVESAKIEQGRGIATVRFSSRDEVAPIWKDVSEGILRNVSMGAVVHQLKEVTEKGAPMKRFLAIDWEPMEVSLVPVGADPGAQVLSQQGERFPCIVRLTTEENMTVRLLATNEIVEIEESEFDETLHSKQLATPRLAPQQGSERAEDLLLAENLEADKKRGVRIREIAMHYELDEVWAQRQIKMGANVTQATEAAVKERAKTAPNIDGRISVGEERESLGWRADRMSEALYARMTKQEPPDQARQFMPLRLSEMAFALLKQRGETRGRSLDPLRAPGRVFDLAMTTSDFPNLLANALNKSLEAAYNLATPTFRLIASRREFNDYRAHTFNRAGDFPVPLQVLEGAEITQGIIGEGKETVTALKYGRILAITREVLVNDDMGALGDFGGKVARRIIDFENATFYTRAILPSSGVGPALADTLAVYHSTHANITAGGALSNTLLGEAWAKMQAQTSIDGLKLNIGPRFLLTSPASHILARTLLKDLPGASQASAVNPFAGVLEAVSDANLTGTRFYVLSDPGIGTNYIYGTIDGAPRFAVRDGWEVEAVQVKVVHDFGCGAIDYRFGVSGAGA